MKLIGIVYDLDYELSLISLSSFWNLSVAENTVVIKKRNNESDNIQTLYKKTLSDFKIITGENGVGKTTILKDIYDHQNRVNKCGYIYWSQEKISEYSNSNGESFHIKCEETLFLVNRTSHDDLETNSRNITCHVVSEVVFRDIILYSNTLELKPLPMSSGNISTSSYLENDSYKGMIDNDMKNHLIYIFSKPLNKKRIDIAFRSYNYEFLKDAINFDNKYFKVTLSQKGNAVASSKGFSLPENNIYNKLDLVSIFSKDFIDKNKEILSSSNYKNNIKKVLTIQLFSIILSVEMDENNEALVDFYSIDYDRFFIELKNKYIDLFEAYFSCMKIFDILSPKISFKNILLKENNYRKVLQSIDSLISLLKNKEPLLNDLLSILTIEWTNLSFGEYTFLTLFSRIHNAIENSSNNDFLLLLDEIDLGLHPSWQLMWVDKFIESIRPILSMRDDIDIQVIATSHSPLVLTDIPINSITFLDKFKSSKEVLKMEQTFGNNIQTILYNGFFLKETIGSFSKKYIQEVDRDISNIKNRNTKVHIGEFESILEKIKLIGDPVYNKLLTEDLIQELLASQQEQTENVIKIGRYTVTINDEGNDNYD